MSMYCVWAYLNKTKCWHFVFRPRTH